MTSPGGVEGNEKDYEVGKGHEDNANDERK